MAAAAGSRLISTPNTRVGMLRSAVISRAYGMIEDSSATATPIEQRLTVGHRPGRARGAERQREQGRDEQRDREAVDAGQHLADPGAGQDVAGPEHARRAAPAPARVIGTDSPPSRPSSATPAPASSAHTRSHTRRVCTSASSSGPTNSTVTATPSGTSWIAR